MKAYFFALCFSKNYFPVRWFLTVLCVEEKVLNHFSPRALNFLRKKIQKFRTDILRQLDIG